MRPHDGSIDHRVLVLGITRQGCEKPRPNAAHAPTREALVGIAPAAKAFRQIAPRHAHAKFPDYRVDEQTIAKSAVATHRAGTAGQQILDPGELVVPQCMPFHSRASITKAPHESRLR